MKKILIALSLLLTSQLFAQDNSNVEEVNSDAQSDAKDGSIVLSLFGIASEANDRVNNDFNGGFGAFIEFQYDEHIGFETGAFYMNNQYVYSEREINRVSDVNRLHVPVLVKIWPANFINFGVGPYASFRVSDEDKLVRGETYEAIGDGSKKVEYGLDFASSFVFSLDDKTGLFAGARYGLPVEERVRSRIENNFSVLAGLTLQL